MYLKWGLNVASARHQLSFNAINLARVHKTYCALLLHSNYSTIPN